MQKHILRLSLVLKTCVSLQSQEKVSSVVVEEEIPFRFFAKYSIRKGVCSATVTELASGTMASIST